jgi:hypothetical protein
MYIGLNAKFPLLLPDFNETPLFSIGFRKILITIVLVNTA